MNRLILVVPSVVALLAVSVFQQAALDQPTASSVATASLVGARVQFAQNLRYNPPGLFDRGSCELSCRNRYGAPSTWTGDRTQSGTSMDYLRCSNQCDVRFYNQQQSGKPY